MTHVKTRSTIRRRPLDRLLSHDSAQDAGDVEFDFSTPIDRSRWFICPTLTPLYYAPVYRELEERHQRRYNQLTALSFSELIAFFETTFAASVLVALARGRRQTLDRPLVDCLERFVAEERHHTKWWRQLNRLSEPTLYADSDEAIIRLSSVAKFSLRRLTNHPQAFPLVFWVMLALEERSLEISRRCLQMPADQIEPRYFDIYRAHLAHEVRHVQIDWHLIERYYAGRAAALRWLNAKMFCSAIRRFFLPPTRSAMHVVERLVAEHPELKPLHQVMQQQLDRVGQDPAYHAMMYSRESTPITFALFDRFAEFHAMRTVLQSYRPAEL